MKYPLDDDHGAHLYPDGDDSPPRLRPKYVVNLFLKIAFVSLVGWFIYGFFERVYRILQALL